MSEPRISEAPKGMPAAESYKRSECVHCGAKIVHWGAALWHGEGQMVFPQYCRATPGRYASQLHEPLPQTATV